MKEEIIKIAQQIASGKTEVIKTQCKFTTIKIIIYVLRNHSDILSFCPQLEAYSTGKMEKVNCYNLLKIGRGCPFVLFNKTYFDNR